MSAKEREDEQREAREDEAQEERATERGGDAGSDDDRAGAQEASEEKMPPPTLVEWAARLVSVLLLFVLVGYLAWSGYQEEAPIAFGFTVLMEQLDERDGSWVLPVEVTNQGGTSIVNLYMVVELVDEASEVVEEIDLDIALMGHGQRQSFDLWWDRDPRDYEVRFNVERYERP